MTTTVPEASISEPPVPKSFAARFAGVFFSPAPTFADIARKPDFLYPLIAVVIASVAVTETMLAKIGMERIIRASLEHGGQASRMTAEQINQAVERGATVGSVFAHLAGVLGQPIFLLIIAGLGLAILNGILGARVNFKTTFSVACYANLVGILGAVMALAMILFGDAERFNAENPMPSNVGFFLNPLETSKSLMAFASSIDIFTVWFLVVLAMGLSEATRQKVKTLSILLIYFGLWAIWVLGKVGFAMLT